MPKKILIVTKDRMEFNIYETVVAQLEKAGCEVFIVAEGLSMEMWVNKTGRAIYKGIPNYHALNTNTLMRGDIDPEEVLRELSPNLVLTGLGDPIHLGQKFGVVANKSGIPVGFVEDLWGVHKRSEACPDFICTLDAYGEDLIKDHCHRTGKSNPTVYVTGVPSDDALLKIKPDEETQKIVSTAADRIILVGGQDDSTSPLISGLVEALNNPGFNEVCLIIPRFHPKWMADASKVAFRDEWQRLVYQMEYNHRVLWTPQSIDIRSLILASTQVLSIYSNILREAVILGRQAVSWNSDIGRLNMSASLGTAQFPLVGLRAVHEVNTPLDYLALPEFGTPEYEEQIKEASSIVQADGKATERVAQAILSEID